MRANPNSEALRWLSQAEEEHKDAEHLFGVKRYYLALFLCQQSAEKALKAFLYTKEEEPIFSHSVAELMEIASSLDADFIPLKNAKRLDDYYIPTRYPNGLPGEIPALYYDDPQEVQRALEMSSKVIQLVKRKLS